jgi:hypothetical protein
MSRTATTPAAIPQREARIVDFLDVLQDLLDWQNALAIAAQAIAADSEVHPECRLDQVAKLAGLAQYLTDDFGNQIASEIEHHRGEVGQ